MIAGERRRCTSLSGTSAHLWGRTLLPRSPRALPFLPFKLAIPGALLEGRRARDRMASRFVKVDEQTRGLTAMD